MEKTRCQRVLEFLTDGLKMKEEKTKSRKFRKFVSKSNNLILWVGKRGAVRAGKTLHRYCSFSNYVYCNMIEWEKRTGNNL